MKAQLCYELLFCLFFGEAHPNHGRWTCLWSPSFDRSDVLVRWKHQSHHRRNDKEEEQQVLSETRIDCTNDLTILYGNKATEEDILPSSERRHSLPPSSCLCTSWKLRLAPIYSSRNIHQHIERTTHSLLERERETYEIWIGSVGNPILGIRWSFWDGGGSHDDGERAKDSIVNQLSESNSTHNPKNEEFPSYFEKKLLQSISTVIEDCFIPFFKEAVTTTTNTSKSSPPPGKKNLSSSWIDISALHR